MYGAHTCQPTNRHVEVCIGILKYVNTDTFQILNCKRRIFNICGITRSTKATNNMTSDSGAAKRGIAWRRGTEHSAEYGRQSAQLLGMTVDK